MTGLTLAPSARIVIADGRVAIHSELLDLGLPDRDLCTIAAHLRSHLSQGPLTEQVLEGIPAALREHASDFIELLERCGALVRESESREECEHAPAMGSKRVLLVCAQRWGIHVAAHAAAAGHRAHVSCAPDGAAHVTEDEARALDLTFSTLGPGDLVIPASSGWDAVVSIGHPGDPRLCHDVARATHASNTPSLYACLSGDTAIIGPAVIPGHSPCWSCARYRCLANVADPETELMLQRSFFERPLVGTQYRRGRASDGERVLAALVAVELERLLQRGMDTRLRARMQRHDLRSWVATEHAVISLPHCDVCGGAAQLVSDEPSASLEDVRTLADLRSAVPGLVDPISGILSHVVVRRRDDCDPALPLVGSAVVCRTVDPSGYVEEPDHGGGKGSCEREALLGAVGEALERYSASRVDEARLQRCSMRDLDRETFVDPQEVGLHVDPRRCAMDELHAEDPCLWIDGEWLDSRAHVWVPAALAHYRMPPRLERAYCQSTTNGLAAGTSFEDAAYRAACEVIERDAVLVSWVGRIPGQRIGLGELDATVAEVIDGLERLGATVELYLAHTDVPVPTVVCLALGDGTRWPGVTVSSAADLSVQVAVRRAVLEQAYSGVYIRKLMLAKQGRIPRSPSEIETFTDHALYYVPAERAEAFSFFRAESAAVDPRDFQEPGERSLHGLRARLESTQCRLALVDLTSPDVRRTPFRVVRAIGVGLQPLHCGTGFERAWCRRLKLLGQEPFNREPHPLC